MRIRLARTGGPGSRRVAAVWALRWARQAERDSGTMLMVGVVAVVTMFGFTGIVVAGYAMAAHAARAAADLAALSGATDVAAGGDGCSTARTVTQANRAVLDSCSRVGDQVDFVLTVQVAAPVALSVPGLPRSISAVAHAGSGTR